MQFSIHIREKGGLAETRTYTQNEITIGRIKECDILLAKNNVSKKHTKLMRVGSGFQIVDLGSTNGTYVNGRRIETTYDWKEGDKIYIGDYILEIEIQGAAAEAEEIPPQIKAAPKMGTQTGLRSTSTSRMPAQASAADAAQHSAPPAEADEDDWSNLSPKQIPDESAYQNAFKSQRLERHRIEQSLAEPLTEALPASEAKPLAPLSAPAAEELTPIPPLTLNEHAAPAPREQTLPTQTAFRKADLGDLCALFEDFSVEEIFIGGPDDIWIKQQTQVSKTALRCEAAVLNKFVNALRLSVTPEAREKPIFEATFAGMSIGVVQQGPALSIVKPLPQAPKIKEWQALGLITETQSQLLEALLTEQGSLLVAGSAARQVRHAVNLLADLLPLTMRLAVMEQSPLMRFDRGNLFRLQRQGTGRMYDTTAEWFFEMSQHLSALSPDCILLDELAPRDALGLIYLLTERPIGLLAGLALQDNSQLLATLNNLFFPLSGMNEELTQRMLALLALRPFWIVTLRSDAHGDYQFGQPAALFYDAEAQALQIAPVSEWQAAAMEESDADDMADEAPDSAAPDAPEESDPEPA